MDKYPFVHRFIVPLDLRLRRTSDALYELSGWCPIAAAVDAGDSRIGVSDGSALDLVGR